MKKSAKIGGNEFDYSLPEKPEVSGDGFLNKARPEKGARKIFKKIAAGGEISGRDERSLELVAEKLWRLCERAVRSGDEKGEWQSAYVYELISKLLEYARTIRNFSNQIAEAEKRMEAMEKGSEFEKLQHQRAWKMAAIKQNRLMIRDIHTKLKEIPEYFSRSGFAGKILAILSPIGILTSFNPAADVSPDPGIIEDEQALVAEEALETIEEEDWSEEDEDPDDGWMEDAGMTKGGDDENTGYELLDKTESTPDMGTCEWVEDTEMDRAGTPAMLEFEFTNEIYRRFLDGKLWVNRVKKPEGAPNFHEYSCRESPDESAVAARAVVNIQKPAPESRYLLPHPIGTNVVNVRVEPESLEILKADREGTLIFAPVTEADVSARVSYDLVMAEPRFRFSTQYDDSDSGVLHADAGKAVERLKSSPVFAENILRDYLSHYTYITSNQLQGLLGEIPGSYQEKMQHIRFGDCDMLSDHGAYLLQRGGIPAMTSLGFMDKGENRLKRGNGHGQILFRSNDGDLKEFESTGPASIHGAFKHLRFKKKDYAELEAIADRIKQASTDEERVGGYKEFDQKLRKILSGRAYRRFRVSGERGDFASTLTDMAEQLLKQDSWKKVVDLMGQAKDRIVNKHREKDILEQLDGDIDDILGEGATAVFRILIFLLALSALAGAMFGTILGTGIGVEKLYGLEVERQRRKIKDRIGTAAERMLREAQPESPEESKATADMGYGYVDEMIPKEIYDRAPASVRHIFQLMVSAISLIGPEKVIRYHLFGKSKLDDLFRKLDSYGYDSRRLADYIKTMFGSPKLRALADAQRKSDKEKIVANAGKIAAKFYDRFDKAKPADHAKIQSRILNLHRMGDEDPDISKRTLPSGPFSSGESRPYQRGDDLRSVDWNYYARSDQLEIRVPDPQVDTLPQAKERYALVIDVSSADNDDLSRLLAFIYYVQKFPRHVAITGIELYEHGRRLSPAEAPMQTGNGAGFNRLIEKLCAHGPEGIKNARAFIKSLVDLRWKHKWFLGRRGDDDDYAESSWPGRYGAAVRTARAAVTDEKLLSVGDNFDDNKLIYSFRKKKKGNGLAGQGKTGNVDRGGGDDIGEEKHGKDDRGRVDSDGDEDTGEAKAA